MSNTRNILALLAASTLAGTAGAGILTMTASSTTGTDNWAGLVGYRMELTIDCSTLVDAGSASTFTLNHWRFKAWDASDNLAFDASGSDNTPTISPNGSKFSAVIGLSTASITVNNLVPQADSITFTYAFDGSESLNTAIFASQNSADGLLQLGNNADITGLLSGQYAVPAPGAIALLGFGALAARRRRA